MVSRRHLQLVSWPNSPSKFFRFPAVTGPIALCRETEDVRVASSLVSGMVLQPSTTCIVSLVFAFRSSWSLTLVILSAFPNLMIIHAMSQHFPSPLLTKERGQIGSSATLVDRAVAAIATVKSFNATPHELPRLAAALSQCPNATTNLSAVGGRTSGLSQFVMTSLFVPGFWFSFESAQFPSPTSCLFWACLIATSNPQMCIPQYITLTGGKFAMDSLHY
jgi:ATP-binding cassette, subfamily B (MDR/TAP), member 1